LEFESAATIRIPIEYRIESGGSRLGLTENDGHENDGPSKLQDMKLRDQVTGQEISGHEFAGQKKRNA